MPARVGVTIGRTNLGGNISGFATHSLARTTTREVAKRISKIFKLVENATPGAIIFALRPIFAESQVLVPVRTGKLRRSGFLEAKMTATGARGAIGYGKGGNPDYAAHVHERTDIPHKSPTRSKYLTAAISKHFSQIVPRATQFIQQQAGFA